MNTMTNFHRIHLNLDESAGPRRIQLLVKPDHKQDPSGQVVTVLGCADFDDLHLCLEELAVTGKSTFLSESESGPIFASVPCTAAEVVDYVKAERPLTTTLFAEDASVADMLQRIKRLVARTDSGIRLLPRAS